MRARIRTDLLCIGRIRAAGTILRPRHLRRAAIPTGRRSIAKILEMPVPVLAVVAAAHKRARPDPRILPDRRQVLRPHKPAVAATAHRQPPIAIRTSRPCIAAMQATAARVQALAARRARLLTIPIGLRCIRRTRVATRRMLPTSIRSGLRYTTIKMRQPAGPAVQ